METLKHLLQEYLLIFQKFIERFKDRTPPEEWKSGNQGNVLLIPGFASTWVILKTIGNFLNEKGYQIHNVSAIEPNSNTIEACVDEIQKYIQKNNLYNLIIVAHSKGGIIARSLLQRAEISKRIKIVFNIAVPNKGTLWGYAHVQNLYELSYKSKVISNLSNPAKKIINIYPKTDQNVIPKRNLYLDQAINVEINIVGHTRILESEETIKTIMKYL